MTAARTYPCCACCPDDPGYHADNPPNSHTVPCDDCAGPADLAALCDEVESLRDAVERVRELHEEWPIHGDGDHPAECDCGEPTAIVCRTCCCDQWGDQTADCATYHDVNTGKHHYPPCPTLEALGGAE